MSRLRRYAHSGLLLVVWAGVGVSGAHAEDETPFLQGKNFTQIENLVFQNALETCSSSENESTTSSTLRQSGYGRCLQNAVLQQITQEKLRRMTSADLRRDLASATQACRKARSGTERRVVQCTLGNAFIGEQRRRVVSFGAIAENEGISR
ncbi:hypothetical protein GS501_09755 [Saccharibacter sp. 17.LH.SD]|uniref:hypothetical protein n=1 Tax=Saccharibacter sp. 17.LH.SD TaxID=2689393 RepID=UPI0013709A9F|nr:hypothetical protein [Saccharibacter sp. 17.LH.SD]MXV45312.1 hypothetical protein [Saccharibacter sp. 17.LH.SD]